MSKDQTPGALRRALARALRMSGLGAALALLGLPAAAVQQSLSMTIGQLSSYQEFAEASSEFAYRTGLRSGLGLVLLFAVTFGTPIAWRSSSSPRALRSLVYLVAQASALACGLFIPFPWYGSALTMVLAGTGTLVWWAWQKRWRGSGVAPSALAGVLRPALRPGQVWYAIVPGNQQTKIRPVMLVKEAGSKRWLVSYFTSQPPKTDAVAASYIALPQGRIRGLTKDNWVNVADLRALAKRQFRSYAGIAPTWLYDSVCAAAQVTPADSAITIDEDSAGGGSGPVEAILRRLLGMSGPDAGEHLRDAVHPWQFLSSVLADRPYRAPDDPGQGPIPQE